MRRFWFDALIIVGIGTSIAGAVLSQGRLNGPAGPMWLDILLTLAIVGPLLARRRFPFGAPVAVGAGVVIASFTDSSLVPFDLIAFLAGAAAVFLLAQLRDARQAVAGLAMAVGVEAIVVRNDPRGQVGQFIFVSLIVAIVWVVGFTLGRKFAEADEAKERAARAERDREGRARAAVAEERARIARELHDVVGHSVSVMTVQASGVRRLLRPEQEREREALLIVERTGREALAEMRRMVGVLRRPEEAPALAPQPSLEHLDRLIQQARASRAQVLVNYSDDQIEVMVSDDGQGVGNGDGGGHGLVGMRERVAVYGGEIDAGPQPGGGYRLRAKLPLAT